MALPATSCICMLNWPKRQKVQLPQCPRNVVVALQMRKLGRSCSPETCLGTWILIWCIQILRYLSVKRSCRGWSRICRLDPSTSRWSVHSLAQNSPSLLLPACIFLRRPSPAPVASTCICARTCTETRSTSINQARRKAEVEPRRNERTTL